MHTKPEFKNDTFLIAIYPKYQQQLYRSFRDYFIFLSLVRELAQTTNCKLYGFSWLPSQALHIGQFKDKYFIDNWIAVMKRYCYWLQLVAHPQHQFIIRLIKLPDRENALEALKYVHLSVIGQSNIHDPLAYHWHSLPIYHQYWDMRWLTTKEILATYSTNDILARDAFRQHMLTPITQDFARTLQDDNIAIEHISDKTKPNIPISIGVQESKTEYHKQLIERTSVEVAISGHDLEVTVKHRRKSTQNNQIT